MVVKGLWIAKELQLSYQTLTDAETYHATEGACNPQFTREDVVNNNEHYKEFKEHYKELKKRIKFKLAYFMMSSPAGTCMHGREREREREATKAKGSC